MNKTIQLKEQEIYSFSPPVNQKKWRIAQAILFIFGIGIFLSLVLFPKLGVHLFWNLLIPVAPALFVFSTGLWRNICPLSTFSLLPQRFDFSKKIKMKTEVNEWFSTIGIALIFVLVPMRHLLFDTNGMATAILLAALATAAFVVGSIFESKSAWCSGACPIHAVEKLYGEKTKFTVPNARCGSCVNCVGPCPDSTPAFQATHVVYRNLFKKASSLLTGAFPGFVWGWFQVPDYTGQVSISEIMFAYAWPWSCGLLTYFLFISGRKILDKRFHSVWTSFFAGAAVACYYWYRIPALIGFGLFPGDGMLVNLNGTIPEWVIYFFQIPVSAFFIWWFYFKNNGRAKEWTVRPKLLAEK